MIIVVGVGWREREGGDRERERERERNIIGCLLHTPQQGIKTATLFGVLITL